MVKRIRPARHYQHPQAAVRRIADFAIPKVRRALKTALRAGRKVFDSERAVQFLRQGRYAEVAGLMDWHHAKEALRLPMNLLGDVWVLGGQAGARKINGAFAARRRVVRYRKASEPVERQRNAGHGLRSHGLTVDELTYLEKVAVEKDAADQFDFDRFDPVTQNHIRQFQDALITSMGADARAVIEHTIVEGMRAGKGAEDIVADIRNVIGLTPQQASAVIRFRTQLQNMDSSALQRGLAAAEDKATIRAALANGMALTSTQIDDMVATYEDNYLDYRAGMIATTEATRAASLGLQDSYEQAINRGAMPKEAVRQYWQISLDERTCDHCLSVVDRNPDGVPFGEQFDSDDGPVDAPPYHPNCRCSLEFVTDLDLVPDDYAG